MTALRTITRRGRSGLDAGVLASAERSVSPLLGLIRRLTVATYDAAGPCSFTVLPELADFHRHARIRTKPEYHVGGYGFSLEEAMVRALGESAERAAHVTFHVRNPHLVVRRSQTELDAEERAYLPLGEIGRFSPSQRSHPSFPFGEAGVETLVSWMPAIDLRRDAEVLLPAQALLTGFTPVGEPRTAPAMTTGTATHVTYGRSLLNALLELLELDAGMGHWYSGSVAPRIEVSAAGTPRLHRFMELYAPWLTRAGGRFEFYWLRGAGDLPVYVVACAYRAARFPSLALGMGAALDLDGAMYSALREAIPITLVALLQGLSLLHSNGEEGTTERLAPSLEEAFAGVDLRSVTDLETAVAFYAWPENAARLFPSRFDPGMVVDGAEIRRAVPPLVGRGSPDAALSGLLAATLREHRLYAMDLTTEESIDQGFRVTRLYSPDLLPLFFPSFPEALHPRLAAYGGFHDPGPHPYP